MTNIVASITVMSENKNTILVSSYPKSGATWFQFLIYSCYNGQFTSSREVLRFYPPQNRKELIHKSKQDPLFIKTHSAYGPSIPYLTEKTKCILIVRNPLDVAFSLINHHKNQGSLRLLLSIFQKKFIADYFNENIAVKDSSWSYHIASWKEQNKYPLQIITYEELINLPKETLIKLRDTYQLKFSDEDISKAVKFCSLENMKALEKREVTMKVAGLFYSKRRKLTNKVLKSSFINKGGSGNYKSKLSSANLDRAAKIFNPILKEIGHSEIS